ncbi:hypothetical protein Q5M85_00130 [Paraclostridium bifermentans]|nr:hypothetical protein [Paraclostridium bifermentans]
MEYMQIKLDNKWDGHIMLKWLRKLEVDMSNVKTLEDLGPVLEKVKASNQT